MSSLEYAVSPRAVDVLPSKVARRLTRRDGLLPLVFALELLTGLAFGLAAHSGDTGAAGVPARLTLSPVAQVGVQLPVAAAVPVPTPTVRKHAPVNPFGALVHTAP